MGELSLAEKSTDGCVYSVVWIAWGKPRWRARILLPASRDSAARLLAGCARGERETAILVAKEGWRLPEGFEAEAQSVVYFWDLSRLRLLEPNGDVEVEVLKDWGEAEEREFEAVMRRSWGFYRAPRRGDHLVVLARLEGTAVGLTYLNRRNYNLDYGVHVVREYWRRRIGTRVLSEALSVARELGAHYVSVVRVYRKVGGTAADRRASSFYRANGPRWRYVVYRVRQAGRS